MSKFRLGLILINGIIMLAGVAFVLWLIKSPIFLIIVFSLVAGVATSVAASRFDTKDLFLKTLVIVVVIILIGYIMYSMLYQRTG